MKREISYKKRNALSAAAQAYLKPDMLFFDLETTGLKADRCSIYCIGTGRMLDGDTMVTELLFAQNSSEESEVLAAFCEMAKDYRTFVTFNGKRFDVPFLEKRLGLHGMFFDFDVYTHIDLFRAVRTLRGLLRLPNYKQVSVENFLGIPREDEKNGGELISVYFDYCRRPTEEAYRLLCLHNHDDICGMFELMQILSYTAIYECRFDIIETGMDGTDTFFVLGSPSIPLPRDIRLSDDLCAIHARSDRILIELPVFSMTLRHYFKDYQNYYYLPDEQAIVHKSVGQFVDKSHREPATAANCYVSKTGRFLALPRPSKDEGLCYFKANRGEHKSYLDVTDLAGITYISWPDEKKDSLQAFLTLLIQKCL